MSSQEHGNTVFLTKQEVERIRQTVVNRRAECDKVIGQTPEVKDAESSIKGATGASLMADMAGGTGTEMEAQNRGRSLPVLTVGQLHPPCTRSLGDLRQMQLSDLKLETHHRGQKLYVKRVSPVVTLRARSWAIVQDHSEEAVQRIEIVLHKLVRGDESLESSKHFAIKEPYLTLTEDGEATIRVDHPSDLVAVDDQWIANTLTGPVENGSADTSKPTKLQELADSSRTKGNAAVKKQDMLIANYEYTTALRALKSMDRSEETDSLIKETTRSRAIVNFSLGQADDAIADAKASILCKEDQESKELDSQVYSVAARAAYSLRQYYTAKEFIEQTLKLAPDNSEAGAFLRKVEARIKQQESGKYDMKKIKAGLSQTRPEVDAADSYRKTAVKESPGRGRGLYAVCDIPSGAVIMCEKAFCVVWGFRKDPLTAMTYDVRDERIRVAPVGLTRAVVQKLIRNPSQRNKVLDLYGDYTGNVPIECMTEEGAVVDVFRIHDIVSRNGFSPGAQFGEENAENASTGLWIRADYANHSCNPNTAKEFVGDLMIMRAARAIKAGEELFHTYVDPSIDYDARQRALMDTWGFECSCELCKVQSLETPAVRQKRSDLIAEAEQFLGRVGWHDAKRLEIVRAQRLFNSIEGTYDQEKYRDLQFDGAAMQGLRQWLSKASPRK